MLSGKDTKARVCDAFKFNHTNVKRNAVVEQPSKNKQNADDLSLLRIVNTTKEWMI